MSGDQEQIERRIRNVEQLIDEEVQQNGLHEANNAKDTLGLNDVKVISKSRESVKHDALKEGKETNIDSSHANSTNPNNIMMSDRQSPQWNREEPIKDNAEDGGEMVEGEEDTVIY